MYQLDTPWWDVPSQENPRRTRSHRHLSHSRIRILTRGTLIPAPASAPAPAPAPPMELDRGHPRMEVVVVETELDPPRQEAQGWSKLRDIISVWTTRRSTRW
jgi:hypothetical protein